jgi:hypothetical protein
MIDERERAAQGPRPGGTERSVERGKAVLRERVSLLKPTVCLSALRGRLLAADLVHPAVEHVRGSDFKAASR